MTLVSLKNVSFDYQQRPVLEDVTLKVAAGEFISLIGANGAGKSTILKLILGELHPVKGTVVVAAKKIGYVPQTLTFDRSVPLTVTEFLQLFVEDLDLEMLPSQLAIGELLKQKLGELSGGQLQRVLIAQAILQKPDLILLDEATSEIDMLSEQEFYQLIKEVRADFQPTIILVSHDLHTVFANTDRVICLDKCVCCQGTPKAVAKDPEFKRIFGDYLVPYRHDHKHHDHVH